MPRCTITTSRRPRRGPASSRTTRNLPTRLVAATVRPVSASTKSRGAGSRRTARSRPTSTATTVRPRSTGSRSLRTTSTSGSSGIARERGPRGARRGLLRLLLRPSLAVPVHRAADRHHGEELLRVVRALGPHLVARQLLELSRRVLLEPGLEVALAGAHRAGLDPVGEEPEDELACDVPTGVEVDGGDDGLHRVGEDRRLVASP